MVIPSPSVRISQRGFVFNAACMRLMEDVAFVQFLPNFKEGQLFAVECDSFEEDKAQWRHNFGSRKVNVKRVKWPRFYKRMHP